MADRPCCGGMSATVQPGIVCAPGKAAAAPMGPARQVCGQSRGRRQICGVAAAILILTLLVATSSWPDSYGGFVVKGDLSRCSPFFVMGWHGRVLRLVVRIRSWAAPLAQACRPANSYPVERGCSDHVAPFAGPLGAWEGGTNLVGGISQP